jgi:hypothetical protein
VTLQRGMLTAVVDVFVFVLTRVNVLVNADKKARDNLSKRQTAEQAFVQMAKAEQTRRKRIDVESKLC